MSQPVTPSASRPPTPVQDALQSIQFIGEAFNSYTSAQDEIVCLRVKNNDFNVSKSRLILRSPVFRDMFALSEGVEGGQERKVVELHDDPEEFKHFLWFIHADPLAGHEFSQAEASPRKCSILLGIASSAHRYQADGVANWAMRTVLSILMGNRRSFSLDGPLAKMLLRTAARFQDSSSESFAVDARDVVCDAIHPDSPGPLSEDPIIAVLAAREVDDTYVLSHAYFYTLQKGNKYWRGDEALSPLDRRRLVCGDLLWRCQIDPACVQGDYFGQVVYRR
ncbi:hypothetical protein AURDEDRAFT_174919 [Auricularia subglabra TFB-10046 SS5]|uniref:BTB domain-containing protein n=1 Tax=Auricularia subglabra (strain TFB-10046 / SS5) TaxID=717982 RepID=J0WSF2_AURST|nr:hypothetical protein AURDEDRAFT_174919 [Auricularia subglabra TFB-10046 SS5]